MGIKSREEVKKNSGLDVEIHLCLAVIGHRVASRLTLHPYVTLHTKSQKTDGSPNESTNTFPLLV